MAGLSAELKKLEWIQLFRIVVEPSIRIIGDMQTANAVIAQWGPALLVCFTVVLGLFYSNARITDVNRRIDDLRTTMDGRFADLKSYLGTEFKRMDERFDRL